VNPLPEPDAPIAEKRSLENLIVCLIDKSANAIWISIDPLSYTPVKIIEKVVPVDRETVLNALSRCILRSEVIDYQAGGDGPVEGVTVTWSVRLYPLDRDGGALSCVALCQILPEHHAEIREDELTLLRLLADDCTLKEISEKMFLSDSSIDTKMRQLKAKLGVKNIGGLVATAITGGLI